METGKVVLRKGLCQRCAGATLGFHGNTTKRPVHDCLPWTSRTGSSLAAAGSGERSERNHRTRMAARRDDARARVTRCTVQPWLFGLTMAVYNRRSPFVASRISA